MSMSFEEQVKGLTPKINRRARRQLAAQEARKNDRAASYARFSSELQDESSNADQHRKNEEKAKRNEHSITPTNMYSDEEVSGTKADRVGLNRMLEDAKAGKFSTIYFFSLSRLARQSLIGMSILKNLVHVHHIRVISVSEGIDSDQPGWELAAEILSMFHEQYIKQLAHDVLRGQEGVVLDGKSVGDHRFGFASVAIPGAAPRSKGKQPPKQYKIIPSQAEWVIKIFTWFATERRSITEIAKLLNTNNVPKDHRSTVSTWSHGNIVSVLESVKHVGIWPWGAMKNMRDPETGRVWQEPRSEDEISEGWVRYREDLQIVDVDIFKAAQERLKENRDALAESRNDNGQFSGNRGSRGNPPRHLVSSLLYCSSCGHKLYIGGAHSSLLFCPNNRRGTCDCKTMVQKDLVARLILETVVEAVTTDEAWLSLVHKAALMSWRKRTTEIPQAIVAAEHSLKDIDKKIERLVDLIENGSDEASISSRLKKRRKERSKIQGELAGFSRTKESRSDPPTRDEVVKQIQGLVQNSDKLESAAIEALHTLLGGRVEATDINTGQGKGKRFWRGKISLKVSDATRLVLGYAPSVNSEAGTVTVEVDFKDEHPLKERSEIAKSLYDKGLMNKTIGETMDISKPMVTKLIRYWFESRGMEMPDGRTRRSNLKKKHTVAPIYQQISDRVKELMDEGMLLQDIAETLSRDRNTITEAARFWYESRGLEYEDGRHRRKSLSPKSND